MVVDSSIAVLRCGVGVRSAATERAAPQHKTSIVVCAVFDRVIFYSQSIFVTMSDDDSDEWEDVKS